MQQGRTLPAFACMLGHVTPSVCSQFDSASSLYNGGNVAEQIGFLVCSSVCRVLSNSLYTRYSSVDDIGEPCRLKHVIAVQAASQVVVCGTMCLQACKLASCLFTQHAAADVIVLCTLCLKKVCHFYFCNNFGKYRPILIILSLLYSQIYC